MLWNGVSGCLADVVVSNLSVQIKLGAVVEPGLLFSHCLFLPLQDLSLMYFGMEEQLEDGTFRQDCSSVP